MRLSAFASLVACVASACFSGVLSPEAVAASLKPRAVAVQGVESAILLPVKVQRKHRVHSASAMEAYLFLPGVGTVVVSVAASGKTTIAPVPAHLNELNFTLGSRSQDLSNIGLRSRRRLPSKPQPVTPKAQTARLKEA